MAGIKISALPAAGSANGTDQIPTNQTGTTRRITVAQILAGAGTLTSVTGTSPINSSGGTTPNISFDFSVANTFTDGQTIDVASHSPTLLVQDSADGYNDTLRVNASTPAVGVGGIVAKMFFTVAGYQASNSASPGNNGAGVSIIASKGGNDVDATDGTGGDGGAHINYGGAGGDATAGATTCTGGPGGDYTIGAGNGGDATGTGGINISGRGGHTYVNGADHGVATNGAANNTGFYGGVVNNFQGSNQTAAKGAWQIYCGGLILAAASGAAQGSSMRFTALSATCAGIGIQGFAAQTGDLFQIKDSAAANLYTVGPTGYPVSPGTQRVVSDVTNATTTFAAITGLSVTLIAGRKYIVRCVYKCVNSVAADGVKFDFNGGTATMTSFWAAAAAEVTSGTVTVGTAISTSLAGVINYTAITGETIVVVEISMVVNAAGTFIARFAENAHTTGSMKLEIGSSMLVDDSLN